MKKFINDVAEVVAESLAGLAAAHPEILRVNGSPVYVARAVGTRPGKVVLVSGGGSGHEPLHAGFVGQGMLDAACPGAVFTSPTPDQIAAAARAVDSGAGVLLIVKNYDGDIMNFEMAAEIMDVRSVSVTVNDDVAVDDSAYTTGRRGVAGTVVVEKMAGALAEEGADLEACRALAARVVAATRSVGVALTSCTVPAVGRPTFDIGEDEMEVGVGIHGEPGRSRVALGPAREIARDMIDAIVRELPPGGRDVLLLTNGFAATPLMELYLMHGLASRLLEQHGLRLRRSLVGNFCTSLDMAGCSFTVTRLDDELCRLWDAPARTAALRC